LQSSLNQQPVVRQTLYESLPEVVSRNPELVPECVKMLRNHLKFYVEQQTTIQLELCVSKGDKGTIQVVEPLGHSIQALLQVILEQLVDQSHCKRIQLPFFPFSLGCSTKRDEKTFRKGKY
jgi:hypothetical protein